MTQKQTRSTRAALFIGAALLSTPAFAQDAQVTPPPVVSTVPQTPAPAPAPTVTFAPATPTVQAVPERPAAQTPPRETATRTTTTARRTSAATTRQVTRTTAPAAAAPAPAPEPVPAAAPVEQAAAAPEQLIKSDISAFKADAASVATPADTATAPTESAPTQTALWPWLLGGALIVAGIIAALLFRRRGEYEEEYVEPYEPVAAAQPVAAPERTYIPRHEPEVAPLAAAAPAVMQAEEIEPVTIAEDVEIAKADAEDLADLTAAAPVSQRPWLEFGMRPVRAGTSADEALVELELTVANSGDVPAKDVRISTFLLKDADAGEMERMLTGHESSVPPVTIGAGDGTRVDATLAVRKDELRANGDSFSPVVVADARYTMADGSEGRTSATFRVGLWNGEDGIEPINIGRPQMHDNVAAELHGTPEHA